MGKLRKTQFVFRRQISVGAEDAEQDTEYRDDCFFDTGDYEALSNTDNIKRIVVGRTGAGKTALLLQLRENNDRVIWLKPESLSLQYLSNSTLLPVLSELGVNLDLFYRLLWRHILVVELIKARYGITDGQTQENFLRRILEQFQRSKAKQQAIEYVRECGENFWQETEYRIKEVTQRFEDEVKGAIGAKAAALTGSLSESQRLNIEEKAEIVYKAQQIVNAVQIKKLSDVIDLLAYDIFVDPQPAYFVIIDRLDENWVDDVFRYKLIRALIEAVKDMEIVRPVKVIISLRRDLLERVISITRDAGFQEEKYEPLYLDLKWSKEQLLQLLDLRIEKMVRRQYTGQPVSHHDLMPARVHSKSLDEYLVGLTMMRPRDIIVFFNCCIQYAEGKPEVTLSALKEAEGEYSRRRFRSLLDEWNADYPELSYLADLLKSRPDSFRVSDLEEGQITDICLEIATSQLRYTGELSLLAKNVAEGRRSASSFVTQAFAILYRIGMVGLKTQGYSTVAWSFQGPAIIPAAEIDDSTLVRIHPAFARILGSRNVGTGARSNS